MDTEIHSSSRWHTDIYAHDATATLLSITSLTDRQTLFEPCGWVLRYKLAGPEGWERVWSCCGAFRRLSSLRSLSHIHVLPCKYIPATKGQHWALGCSLEHNSLARGIQPSLPVFWGVPSSLLLDTACLGRYRLPRFPWYGAWYGIFPWGCFQWEGCKGWTTQPASAPKQTTWCRAWGLISCRTSVAGRAAWGGGGFRHRFCLWGVTKVWLSPSRPPTEWDPARVRVGICSPRVTTDPEGCTWCIRLEGLCLVTLSGLPWFGGDVPKAPLAVRGEQAGALRSAQATQS